MNTEEFLRRVTALPGVTGNEGAAAAFIAEAFRPYADEVSVTPLQCVIAHKKGPGPRVMICAHLDEIGMMVSKIEEDGCLRLQRVGGVDPRVLPGMRVRVFARDGELMGVVGAVPPHLQTDKDKEHNYDWDTLFVDMGMSAERVRQLVRVGDTVCFESRFALLKNGRAATKTADDRACVAIMLEAAKRLQRMVHRADLYFVATCQEEIGSFGALTGGFALDPDYGVAFDVCHADTPGAPKNSTSRITSLVTSKGPYLNPFLVRKLEETAKDNGIELQLEADPWDTSTDADELSAVRRGVPTVLLSLPIKYMHTNVETLDLRALTEGGRLLAHFLAGVEESWEEQLWT